MVGKIPEKLQTAWLNAQARQAQCNLDMLTGAGAYADLQQQILYDPVVLYT